MLRRLAAAALGAGTLYATFLRPGTPAAEVVTDARVERLNELSIRRNRALVRWSALAARDTALNRIATVAADQRDPRIFVSGFSAEATSPTADSMVRNRWKAVGEPASSTLIRVLLYNDAPYDSVRPQAYAYSGALLVTSPRQDICVAMTPGSLNAKQRIAIVKSQLDRALAPCLLLAAFGAPGKGTRRWLEHTRYSAAQSNAWLDRPRSFLDGGRQTPWASVYDDSWSSAFAMNQSSILTGLSAVQIALMLIPPYQMGGPALRCLDGNESECARIVLEPIQTVGDTPRDLTYSWGFARGIQFTLLAPHPIGEWFLSDLIRDQGREQFARLWKSDQPFEAAFREVYGKDLGSWTREWGRRQWEGSWGAIESSRRVILGASLAPSWPLLVLAWTAVAVLIAAWTAKRRQVTT